MKDAVTFYTAVLDFQLIGTWSESESPSFSILAREGCELYLSTHSGDGAYGSVAIVLTKDIQGLFKELMSRGLDTSRKRESPVHQGPVMQTWGTTEFYVNDPDENTLRFIQR
jgi:hypothetical protein